MTEHKPIDPDALEKLVRQSGGGLSSEEHDRVRNHVLWSEPHTIDFSVLYRQIDVDPELNARFEATFRAHSAAILRREVTAKILWTDAID